MINKCFQEKIDVGYSWDLPPVLDNPRQSIRFWIPYCGFLVLGLYWILYPLSVELGFSIPIISRIPNFLSCIPDSKAQGSGFHKKSFSGFQIPQEKVFFTALQKPDYLTWGNQLLMGSNPVEVLNFFQASHLCNCINCVHNCKDHSLFFFDLTTAYCWSLSGDGVGQLHEISSIY